MPSAHEEDPKLRNRFNQMHSGGANRAARAADEALTFEQERLRFLLGKLKLKYAQKDIAKDWENHCGRYELRFAAFNNRFPTFPFLLGANTLRDLALPYGKARRTPFDYAVHTDPYSTEPSRFKQFQWVPYVVAYKEFYELVAAKAETRKIAMVFPRKGFLHGMVIHNDDTEQYWTHGLCQVYKFPDRGTKLFMLPFQNLIEGVYSNGHGWRP